MAVGISEPEQAARIKVKHPRLHLEGLVTRLVLAGIYLTLSDRLTIGPRWLTLALVLVFLLPINLARWRGNWDVARHFATGLAALTTLIVVGSAGLLLAQLPEQTLPARDLLRDGALIWTANILNFTLWYWQIDGGGPDHRRHHRYAELKTDFLFPQQTVTNPIWDSWAPGFIDYLFVAFNASAAFSPTDTLVMTRRAKVLMMVQSSISVIVVVVLVARAINTLG